MNSIAEPYLLFICVPLTVDPEGCHYADALWAKDLAMHLEYLDDLTLARPVVSGQPRAGRLATVRFAVRSAQDRPAAGAAGGSGPCARCRALTAAWRSYRQGSDRPNPVCRLAAERRLDRRPDREAPRENPGHKRRLVVLRTTPGATWNSRLRGWIAETVNRCLIRAADLRFFTSDAYLRDFLPAAAPRAHVIPANWIDDEQVLGDGDAAAMWDSRSGPTRLLFAGRLIPQKGVLELLQAAKTAGQVGANLDLTVVGEGPLRQDCLRQAGS